MAERAPAGASVQEDLSNVPPEFFWKATSPLGTDCEPAPMSVTVAVQVAAVPTRSGSGVQSTEVEVGRLLGAMSWNS